VQKLVEANYVNGRPRHHLPSARSIEPLPDSSTFFIIEHDDFIRLSPDTIQAIARDRDIVVQHVPQREFDWSLATLSEVGNLDQARDIQVGECRDDESVIGMLKVGTLRDIFESSGERVLSCLNLPTSNMDVVATPGLR
jgi:hypothetical protein